MGKKSGKSKQRKGAKKGKAKQQDATLPDLPVEVIAVIAEHLIGQYAFGTAASVNTLSKAVHRETLPVLYESFFCKHYQQLPYYREGDTLPDGLRYTKFAYFVTENPNAKQITDKLVNLVMSVSVDRDPATAHANECQLRLYKPLSSHTAFRIAGTPVRHPVRNHEMCKIRGVGRDFLHLPKEEQMAFMKEQSPRECAEEQGKPPVRSCEAIRSVSLEKEAVILPPSTSNTRPFTTDLCLGDATLACEGNDDESALVVTAVQLLKLMGLQSHPAQHALRDRKMVMLRLLEDKGHRICGYTRYWPRWNLRFSISSKGLEDLTSQLEAALPSTPEIVKNRIFIKLTDKVDISELQSYIYTLYNLYSPHIKYRDMVLPTIFAHPISTPVRIDTIEQLERVPIAQRDATRPPKRVRWSGRISVHAGKGQSVAVKPDFQDLALHYPSDMVDT